MTKLVWGWNCCRRHWKAWFYPSFRLVSSLRIGRCICCCSVAQACPTICDPMDCSTPGLPVPHHLPEGIRHVQTPMVVSQDSLPPLYYSFISSISQQTHTESYISGTVNKTVPTHSWSHLIYNKCHSILTVNIVNAVNILTINISPCYYCLPLKPRIPWLRLFVDTIPSYLLLLFILFPLFLPPSFLLSLPPFLETLIT